MNAIQKLVPPPYICRQIPNGAFVDSVFVYIFWHKSETSEIKLRWEMGDSYKDLVEDGKVSIFPAPMLEEIMKALPAVNWDKIPLCCTADRLDDDENCIMGKKWRVGYSMTNSAADRKASTAALNLWIGLNTVKEKTK